MLSLHGPIDPQRNALVLQTKLPGYWWSEKNKFFIYFKKKPVRQRLMRSRSSPAHSVLWLTTQKLLPVSCVASAFVQECRS